MKRKDLLRELSKIARTKGVDFELVRQGGNHEIYRVGTVTIPVGRHTEINERTARSILRGAAAQ